MGIMVACPIRRNGMDTPEANRITELEVKLAFAEDMLDALNKTVYRQQEQIDRLAREMRELRELREQIAAATPGEFRSLRDEIPPHY